ncbi:hypothetical protein MALU111345_21175 [Marinicrinis lubricantis]
MLMKPMSLRFIQIFMIFKIALIVIFCILFGLFFIEAGDSWESFKSGALNSALGIEPDEYDARNFGRMVGYNLLPFVFSLWTLSAMNNRKYKSLVLSLVLHFLLSLQNPFYLLLSLVMLVLSFTYKVRSYMTDRGGNPLMNAR